MDNSLSVVGATSTFICEKCKKNVPEFKGFTVFSEKYRTSMIRLCKKCNKTIGRFNC